jgi:hypothetical protein
MSYTYTYRVQLAVPVPTSIEQVVAEESLQADELSSSSALRTSIAATLSQYVADVSATLSTREAAIANLAAVAAVQNGRLDALENVGSGNAAQTARIAELGGLRFKTNTFRLQVPTDSQSSWPRLQFGDVVNFQGSNMSLGGTSSLTREDTFTQGSNTKLSNLTSAAIGVLFRATLRRTTTGVWAATVRRNFGTGSDFIPEVVWHNNSVADTRVAVIKGFFVLQPGDSMWLEMGPDPPTLSVRDQIEITEYPVDW